MKKYFFIDQQITDGIFGYRLKQIDVDGTCTFSPIIQVRTTASPNEFILGQNYPNPFTAMTNIEFQIPASDARNASLKIFDVLGREMLDLSERFMRNSATDVSQRIQIQRSDLPSHGMYFIRLQTGAHASTRRMILLK